MKLMLQDSTAMFCIDEWIGKDYSLISKTAINISSITVFVYVRGYENINRVPSE